MIRSAKRQKVSYDAISITDLQQHFKNKFTSSNSQNPYVSRAKDFVTDHASSVSRAVLHSVMVSELMVGRLISKLRRRCAAGADGMTTEQLQLAVHTDLPQRISALLTSCLRYGVLQMASGTHHTC